MKRHIALLLAVIMLLLMVPTTVFASSLDYYEYVDNGDGTCTITDYTLWNRDMEITIPDRLGGLKVTAIGDSALCYREKGELAIRWRSFKSITMPDSIISIGNYAFAGNGLASITIPNKVTYIGKGAFERNNLQSVTLPDNLITIGDRAFLQNRGLASVIFSDKLTTIGDSAFDTAALTSVSIPSSVTSIGKKAFFNNDLTSVTIPDSVTSLGAGVFTRNEITTVNGEASNGIFFGRDNDGSKDDTTIVSYGGASDVIDFIPSSVTKIADYGFDGCRLTNVTIPENVITIGDYAFYANLLTSLTIGDNVTEIGDYAFSRNQLTSVTMSDSVTIIGDEAFDSNELTAISLSNNLTVIGDCAFKNNKLGNIVIPSNVTTIGEQAFTENDLTDVTLQCGDVTIKEKAFYDTKITNVDFAGGDTVIGPNAFASNYITSIDFGEGVSIIGAKAFSYNDLTSVTIPGNNATIGDYAFWRNELITVVLNNVSVIKNKAFYSNEITSVTISGEDVIIGDYAFAGPSPTMGGNDVANLSFTGSIKSIGYRAFYRNDELNGNISIQGNDVDIDDGAFLECNLDGITFDTDKLSIGKYAFGSNFITSVDFSDGIAFIDDNAFDNNDLTSVDLPNMCYYIGTGAFGRNILMSFKLPSGTDEWTDGLGNTYACGDTVTNMDTNYARNIKKPIVTIEADSVYLNNDSEPQEIKFTIDQPGDVTVRITDDKRKTIRSIQYKQKYEDAGTYTTYWDGKDNDGNAVASGSYYICVINTNYYDEMGYRYKEIKYIDDLKPIVTMSSTYNKTSDNVHEIHFRNKFDCLVTVRVSDSNGKTVRNLLYKAFSSKGGHKVYWDGKDLNGKVLPSGTYRVTVINYSGKNYWYSKKYLKYTLTKTPRISSNSNYTKTGSNTHLIKFSINQESKVTVAIRDAKKRTLRNIEYKNSFAAGEHSVYWDGKDNRGNVVKQGTYYIYVIRYDNNGKYHYVRKRLTFTPFKYPTIYSNSYYTRTGSNTHQIKVDIATDAKVSTCIKDANFKTVLYLEYKVRHEDGRFHVYWDGKDKNGNPVPDGTYYIYSIKYNDDGTYKWRRKKLTLN